MRINGHAHIFNLQSVLTPHALTIMVNRVRSLKVPAFVADAVERLLQEQLKRPEYLVREELLARFLGHLAGTKGFKRFAGRTRNLPIEIRLIGGGARALSAAALEDSLVRLSAWFDDGASTGTTIADIFETLQLAMRADVTGVAHAIFEDMQPGDGMIALMMDITSERTHAADEHTYRGQLKGTTDAAIAFPGRVFPFVAVNTRRANHFALLTEAVERFGCTGVKLYPSIGVPVDSPAMARVFDYCLEMELPILLHCTLTGFYENEGSKQLGAPAHWWPILEARPELRVCFAHSGGLAQNVLTPAGPGAGDWPDEIHSLMLSYPNVFCDLAYHVDQMVSPQLETFYLRWLRRLIEDDRIHDRVIFGTDIWLLRLSLADSHYWRWFETQLTPGEQKQIMEDAPANFLGLPYDGAPMRQNIERLVAFLRAQPGVGAEPADWLAAASTTPWTVMRSNPLWTPNNHAHKVTHVFMRDYMTGPQRSLDFATAGALRLRQFTYWRNVPASDRRFRQDTEAIAQALAIFCRNSGGAFEGDHRPNTAIPRLAAFLGNGEKTLSELGATVDSIFRFSTEMV